MVNGTKLANSFYAGSVKRNNLVADFNLENRYTWIDPETGLNLGRPSQNTIAAYGSAEAVMARLNEINQGKVMYNPAGVSKMYLIDYAVEDASFLRVQNITVGYTLPKKWVKAMNIENIRLYSQVITSSVSQDMMAMILKLIQAVRRLLCVLV